VQPLSLARPPGLRILRGLIVDRRIAEQRLLAELVRRGKSLHLQQVGQLAVKLLAGPLVGLAGHRSAARAALAPALAR
jgi:hypothetical protein